MGLVKLFDFHLVDLQLVFCLVAYYYNKDNTTAHYAYCSFSYCAYCCQMIDCIVLNLLLGNLDTISEEILMIS